jgi:uncharacterized protein YbaR (Trm112 family)
MAGRMPVPRPGSWYNGTGGTMVIIFGWGSGEAQDLGEVAPVVCPNCHNDVFLHDIKSEKRVSLFFVPLASYGTNEYLACPICRHGVEVRPEHRGAIDRMRAATKLYRRGQLLESFYRPQVVQFWRRVGIAPTGEQVIQAAATIPAPAVSSAPTQGAAQAPSVADQLSSYAKLHADGVLTDEEFSAIKRQLLDI